MSDISGIIQCVNFAAVQHKDQRRKDPEKTPYINHPIGNTVGVAQYINLPIGNTVGVAQYINLPIGNTVGVAQYINHPIGNTVGVAQYINHPIGVAQLLIEAGVSDCDVIKAALLHDTIEDTNTTQQQLIDTFGPRVAGIVAEVV
ncbi:hypothetical protein Pmani_002069 [Petrolisthes manimaculis]|uniref:Guanosine-3',5'-bis(diphosphate) 3'-pyrophosphohydrolase MESH1 n=1 Tax=Petrolisthes manimaculis TaxID=1843537 RepID=A0AAE1QJ09_9EUCA|nr:hypothetical protein Pmani_002069 [Petrolisthes manimaculis]